MARYVHGINGPLVGRLGNLVASSWRGIPYLKTRPDRKKAFNQNELANQGSFGNSSQWLSPLTPFLRAGFKGEDPGKWGFNGAKSYLHAHAIIKDGGKKVIDPSSVLISQGNLPLGKGFDMHFDKDSWEIIVRWEPKVPKAKKGGSAAAWDDKLMFAVYDAEAGEAYGEVYGASRKVGADCVQVPPGVVATYHVYVAFVAGDGSSRSNSLYLGALSVDADAEGEEEELPSDEMAEPSETESILASASLQDKGGRRLVRATSPKNEPGGREPLSERTASKPAFSYQTQSSHTANQRWQYRTSTQQLYSYNLAIL